MQWPPDDLTIANDDCLIRRVPVDQWIPETGGGWRVSSGAFSSREGVSVEVESRLGCSVNEYLAKHDQLGVVRVRVAAVRGRCEQVIVGDPVEGSLAHALIYGPTGPRKRIAKLVEILQLPPDFRSRDGT